MSAGINVEQEADIEKAKADALKGKGPIIDATGKSKQRRKAGLRKIRSLQDAEDEFGR